MLLKSSKLKSDSTNSTKSTEILQNYSLYIGAKCPWCKKNGHCVVSGLL